MTVHSRECAARSRPLWLPVAALLAACLLGAPEARAEGADPWFGRDKALHFAASGALAGGTYGFAVQTLPDRTSALLLSGSVSLLIGATKELHDAAGYGDASFRDLAWDAAGTAVGLALAWAVDVALRGLHGRPAATRPRIVEAGRSALVRLSF